MSFIKVNRPKLKWYENLYFPTLFSGLKITLGHAVRSLKKNSRGKESLNSSGLGVTMQYPETKWDDFLPEWYRGVPALVTDEQERERCVSCQLCEFICPPKAIRIIPSEISDEDEWSKIEKAPKEFDIDMTRCIYCGLCEEVCPEQAIYLQKDYSVTGLARKDLMHNKEQLYKIGGQRAGLVNKWNKLK